MGAREVKRASWLRPIAAVHASRYMHAVLMLAAAIKMPLRRLVRPLLNYKKGRRSQARQLGRGIEGGIAPPKVRLAPLQEILKIGKIKA